MSSPEDIAPRGGPGPARSWAALLVAAALVSFGSGGLALGASLPDRRVDRLGDGNPPVNAGSRDLADIRGNNSPTLARSPTAPNNLVVVNRVDNPLFSCRLHASLDGGATWFETRVPFPEREELPARCYAPDAAFSADGSLHVSFVTLKGVGNVPNALWVTASTDGGRTLGPPVAVAGPLTFQVRIAPDPNRAGRLYLTYVQASEVGTFRFSGSAAPINVLRSDDGGATWQGPVKVNAAGRARVAAPSAVVGPRGEVYVLYLDLGDDVLDYGGAHEGRGGPPHDGPWSLVLGRSLDSGASWREAVVEVALVPTQRFLVFVPPSPSLAIDPRNGRLYAAFQDGRLGDADVLVWASGDAGASFSPPRRVNDTPKGDGTDQYLPRLAVAPTGRVDVVYYDRRADRRNLMNDVSFQSSFDEGRTFGRRVRLTTRPFDPGVGFGAERDLPELGSRIALVSAEDRALAVWTDTRAGSVVSKKQDLARALVAVRPGSALRQSLRIAGGSLLGAGLVLLVWRGARARRRRAGRGLRPAAKSSGSLQPTGR